MLRLCAPVGRINTYIILIQHNPQSWIMDVEDVLMKSSIKITV